MSTAPARDALAWVIDDAVRYREPDREGCCADGTACRDHDSDQAIADAMTALLTEVERAASDAEALTAVHAHGPRVLAEIAGAAADDDMTAAITGGTPGGDRQWH